MGCGIEPRKIDIAGPRPSCINEAKVEGLTGRAPTVRSWGGLNGWTQHFILEGKDGVDADESPISSRFHGGGEDGIVGSLAAWGVAESD